MKLTFVLVLMLSFSTAHAFDLQSFISDVKEKARPHLVKILGEDKVNDLLGSNLTEVALPRIPEIVKDSRNVESIKRQEYPGTVKISEEDAKKYNYYFVRELFEAVRRREANDNELANWMNVLQQGSTREGVYRGLVLDQTYAGLENYPMPVNDSLVAFASRFLEVYTGKKYETEKLMGFNFFALKRSVTERALEIIDSYQTQQDLAAWYAVFSAELAKNHGNVFDNKTRKNIDPGAHLNWANSYSNQYLKSEVVIKLHKVFNSLI